MLKETLRKVKDVYEYPSVTILMNTYRTAPGIKKNAKVFKNLLDDAKDRLLAEFEARDVKALLENLEQVATQPNFRRNLDSLAVFVNATVCEWVQMPIQVENRVIIDHTFATRDLVRAIQMSGNYYLLSINQQRARLYEAFSDAIMREIFDGKFPMKIGSLEPTGKDKTMGAKYDYVKEFFNRVDKELMEVYQKNPLPLVIAGTRRNYDSYLEVADKKKIVVGYVKRNSDREGLFEVVKDAWELMQQWMETQEELAIKELETAVAEHKIATGVQDIWQAIYEGKGEKLFVETSYFQPGKIVENQIVHVADAAAPGVVDDIVDEIIEYQQAFGGEVIFVENGYLSKYDRIALKLRY